MRLIKEYTDQIKWYFQKKFRGYADIEVWGLDIAIAKFVLPRLRALRRLPPMGHPIELTYEEWLEILDKMIYAMEFIVRDENGQMGREEYCSQENHGKVKEGLELLGKYFMDLWD